MSKRQNPGAIGASAHRSKPAPACQKTRGCSRGDSAREDGYNVDTNNNGVDAVLQYVNNDYTLILLDIAMPRMTGTDALRIMNVVKPPIPVVTFTGHIGQGEMPETVRLGAVSSLPKHVRLDDVKRAVALAAIA